MYTTAQIPLATILEVRDGISDRWSKAMPSLARLYSSPGMMYYLCSRNSLTIFSQWTVLMVALINSSLPLPTVRLVSLWVELLWVLACLTVPVGGDMLVQAEGYTGLNVASRQEGALSTFSTQSLVFEVLQAWESLRSWWSFGKTRFPYLSTQSTFVSKILPLLQP